MKRRDDQIRLDELRMEVGVKEIGEEEEAGGRLALISRTCGRNGVLKTDAQTMTEKTNNTMGGLC